MLASAESSLLLILLKLPTLLASQPGGLGAMVNHQAVARTLVAMAMATATTTTPPTSRSSTIATSSSKTAAESLSSSTTTGVPPGVSGLSELDVLFPQPNKTYPQLSPFPAVFAIQNPQVVYSYEFLIEWDLLLNNCTETGLHACDPDAIQYGGHISNREGDTGFPIPASIGASPVIAYDTGYTPKRIVSGVWQFSWNYYLRSYCEVWGTEVDQYVMHSIGSGSFQFTLAATASPTNPLSSVCPTPVTLISISGSVNMELNYALTFNNCPTTANAPPLASATPCSATLDAAAASSVLSALNVTVVTPTPTPTTTSTRSAAMSLKSNLLQGLWAQAIVLIFFLGLLC